MKTNHQRGFVAKSVTRNLAPAGTGKISEFADYRVGAMWGGDASNGHRGEARAKRGGKKFVRTRIRFQENAETRKLSKYLNENL